MEIAWASEIEFDETVERSTLARLGVELWPDLRAGVAEVLVAPKTRGERTEGDDADEGPEGEEVGSLTRSMRPMT